MRTRSWEARVLPLNYTRRIPGEFPVPALSQVPDIEELSAPDPTSSVCQSTAERIPVSWIEGKPFRSTGQAGDNYRPRTSSTPIAHDLQPSISARIASKVETVKQPSPTTYALLGLLAARSWTGYELTNQLRRSLRFVWPSSEGHLYREQKRLIDLGWAKVEREPVGQRHRNRYTITPEGRRAMRDWLGTDPDEPHLEIEGLVRMFYGDQGSVEDMLGSMEATARMARSMLDTLFGFVDEYLEEGGPLWMLEKGVGGLGQERLVFQDRPQFPERLHVVTLVIDVTSTLLADLEASLTTAADEVKRWPSTADPGITPATRKRLESIRDRGRAKTTN